MKVFFIFLFLAIAFVSMGQSIEDLAKYSYYINGIDSLRNPRSPLSTSGTGFFLKSKGRTYLITAKHVLIGCGYNGTRKVVMPHNIRVWFNDDKSISPKFEPWNIDITEQLKSYPCFPGYIRPDTITILKTTANQVFTVERMYKEKLPLDKGEIAIFGFPHDPYFKSDSLKVPAAKKIIITSYEFQEGSFIQNGTDMCNDTLNYSITVHGISLSEAFQGISGAPVFIKDKETMEWQFLGLINSLDLEENVAFVLKPKFFINR